MTIRVLILNLNNLNFIRDCVSDLRAQAHFNFKVTIIDQDSTEEGNREFLESINDSRFEIIFNENNEPVNKMWNWFANTYDEDLLCFLNNDVRIPKNFILDTIETFHKEEEVGIAVHATNHPHYSHVKSKLMYAIVPKLKYMQGWDYTIRKECFTQIPEELKIYCGDDFLFHQTYLKGFDLAYIVSSPIIHYEGQSKKFMRTTGVEDIKTYKDLGFKHYLKINYEFSNIKPTYKEFKN